MVDLAKRDPSAFWRQVRGRKTEIVIRDTQTWFDHCSNLYDKSRNLSHMEEHMPNEERECVERDGTHGDMQDKFLDAKIRGTEIEEHIKHMKRGKSHDIHGINIELISWGSTVAIDQLEVLFNVLFNGVGISATFYINFLVVGISAPSPPFSRKVTQMNVRTIVQLRWVRYWANFIVQSSSVVYKYGVRRIEREQGDKPGVA